MTRITTIQDTLVPLFAKDDNSTASFHDILRAYIDADKTLGLKRSIVRVAEQIGQPARTVTAWYTGSIPYPDQRRKSILKIKELVEASEPVEADDAPTAA